MVQPLNLVPTLGVTLIGIFLCCTLYGVTTLQTFIYFKKFWSTDSKGLRLFVILIWLLETAHAAFVCSFIFRVTIIDLDSPTAILRTSVSDDVTTGITAFIIFFVHWYRPSLSVPDFAKRVSTCSFYTWRIWILSNKKLILVIPLALGAVVHLGLEMAVMGLTFKWPEFSEFHRITGYFTGAVALAAATDITIAVTMFLLLQGRRTGIKSVIDIVILAAFVGLPDTLVYLCFYDFVPNLYANSLLAMLNSRDGKHPQVDIEVDIDRSANTIQFSNFRSGDTTRNNMENTTHTLTDVDHGKTTAWVK
ncbi:hypothetical protein DFH09DRAFT_1446621 [Mycena vulgaris]|nr:hypothetical protein DFH09DRAFT_1446621 [Mycena vulgaris]